MIDFVTIIFDNQVEIELLKLQALSFNFCEPSIIGKIFIFYNDSGNNKIDFLKEYYPENIRSKVNIIYRDVHFLNNKIKQEYLNAGWRLHAFLKLWLANVIENDIYCFLDAKNHFIKKVTLNNFFENEKYKIFFTQKYNVDDKHWGENYYENGFNYFNIKIPDEISLKYVNIGTPFLYNKNKVIDMMKYIENKEEKSFIDFYMSGELVHVECSIYLSYLYFIGNTDFVYKPTMHFTIFREPNQKYVLDFINDDDKYKNKRWVVFGLHRAAIDKIDESFKNTLFKIYSNIYDKKTCDIIKSLLYK